MAGPATEAPENNKKGWLSGLFSKSADKAPSVGAPTMGNAAPNLDEAGATKMRGRAAEGQAPLNPAGMDKAASAVQKRQMALDNT